MTNDAVAKIIQRLDELEAKVSPMKPAQPAADDGMEERAKVVYAECHNPMNPVQPHILIADFARQEVASACAERNAEIAALKQQLADARDAADHWNEEYRRMKAIASPLCDEQGRPMRVLRSWTHVDGDIPYTVGPYHGAITHSQAIMLLSAPSQGTPCPTPTESSPSSSSQAAPPSSSHPSFSSQNSGPATKHTCTPASPSAGDGSAAGGAGTPRAISLSGGTGSTTTPADVAGIDLSVKVWTTDEVSYRSAQMYPYWVNRHDHDCAITAFRAEAATVVQGLLDIIHDDLTHARQRDHAEAIRAAMKFVGKVGM